MRSQKQEAEAMSKVTIRLPQSLVQRAKIRAIKERRALQEITAEALEAYLKRVEREGGSSR
jgi:hypothetical protein